MENNNPPASGSNQPNQTPLIHESIQNHAAQSSDGAKIKERKIIIGFLALITICLFIFIINFSINPILFRSLHFTLFQKPSPTAMPVQGKNYPTPTPDPTANWKTYSNDTYGYSLKYPTEWLLDPLVADNVTIGPPVSSTYPNGSTYPYIKILIPSGDDANLTMDEFIKKYFTANQIKELTPYKLDGVQGFKLSESNYDRITISYRGKVLDISNNPTTDTKLSIDKNTFDQILSTFKLTN